jgi:hypothetical protein
MTRTSRVRWLAVIGSVTVVLSAVPGWADGRGSPRPAAAVLTGTMLEPQAVAAATLLPSGQVLLAGGIDGVATKRAELFNPTTGKWRGTGPLAHARYGHSAAALPGGRVLVAGGYDYASQTPNTLAKSTEIYTASSGTWRPGPAMNAVHLYAASATLKDGTVLIIGGTVTDTSVNGVGEGWVGPSASGTSELYKPGASAWQTTGSTLVNDSYAHAVTLPDGRVFMGCGTSPGDFEIYNPGADPTLTLAGQWKMAAPAPAVLSLCSLTLLHDGRVLIAGGQRYDEGALDPAELGHSHVGGQVYPVPASNAAYLYSPATDTWASVAGMNAPRFSSTATTLADGRVIVTGGADDQGALATTEVFDPRNMTWAAKASTPHLRLARSDGETTTLLAGGSVVLIAGGQVPAPNSTMRSVNEAELLRL